MKPNPAFRDIFVSDLSFDTTAEELKQLFSLCGNVQTVDLLTDAQGQFKGIAFVRMSSAKETRDAINTLDGTYLTDRRINVTEARSREERLQTLTISPSKSRRRRPSPGRKKVR
ncbi:MAG: RNA-binding protein [Pelovirga sp.]